MRYCIPDELFNLIPYPVDGLDMTGLDSIYREIAYKLPNAEPLVVKKEVWHTLCDFCERTGAYQHKVVGAANQQSINLSFDGGKLLRIVGAEANGARTDNFTVTRNDANNCLTLTFVGSVGSSGGAVYVSVRPYFADETTDTGGDWNPQVPQYLIDRYGECIAHGALARLFAMRGNGEMARMHAVAYNNDLNRFAFGLITSGMRKHLLIDVEDWLLGSSAPSSNGGGTANGNG